MPKIIYTIRLDDACPTMAHSQWDRVYGVLKKHGVMPLVGVIPRNNDPAMLFSNEDEHFWEKMQHWQQDGATIAMHGYNHFYTSDRGGLNPVWYKSEFAGETIDLQREKMSRGYELLTEKGLNPTVFFAPGHTFDKTTLKYLKVCTPIRIVCDTIAFRPYKEEDIVFVPQLFGRLHKVSVPGVWTFCLHPNVMDDEDIARLDAFISKYRKRFVGFCELDLKNVGRLALCDKLLSKTYFALREQRKKRR